MKNKYFKFLIIILAVAVIIPQVALAAWWNPFSWGIWNRIFHFQKWVQNPVVCTQDAKQCPDGSYVSRVPPKCDFAACPTLENNYSFKALKQSDLNKQYADYSVQIYKDGTLVKTVAIKNTYIEPSFFTLSPDQKYVAFKTATYGGTCVYNALPMVIDLNNFSILNLDSSDINKKIKNVLGVDSNNLALKFYATQKIISIKWLDNNSIEVSMQFGDNSGCSIGYIGKPAGSPEYIETKVDFTIIPTVETPITTPKTEKPADQTASSKTFSDDRLPFQFNYPSNWKAPIITIDIPSVSVVVKPYGSEFGGVSFSYKFYGKGIKLDDLINSFDTDKYGIKKTELNLNGTRAVELVYPPATGVPGSSVFIDNDKYGNILSCGSTDSKKLSEIISSLKFVEVKNKDIVNKIAAFDANRDSLIKKKINSLTDYTSEYFIGDDQNSWCSSQKFYNLKKSINDLYGADSNITCSCETSNCLNTNKWCVSAKLSYGDYYCVDSGAQRMQSANSDVCTNGVCQK